MGRNVQLWLGIPNEVWFTLLGALLSFLGGVVATAIGDARKRVIEEREILFQVYELLRDVAGTMPDYRLMGKAAVTGELNLNVIVASEPQRILEVSKRAVRLASSLYARPHRDIAVRLAEGSWITRRETLDDLLIQVTQALNPNLTLARLRAATAKEERELYGRFDNE